MRTFPKLIAIAVLGLLAVTVLAGCGEAAPEGSTRVVAKQDATLLEKSNWVATEIRDESGSLSPVVEGSRVTALFKAGQVAGNASVNTYNATFSTSAEDTIKFGPGATTMMAGPEPLMAQEANYLAALQDARAYSVSAEKLELFDEAGKPIVAFEAAVAPRLTGQTWYATGYNNGKEAFVGLVASSTITINFTVDGLVAGNASVNEYGTSFTVEGENLTISPEIRTTMMAGDKELMQQEKEYLAALPKTTRYEILNDELILWNKDARIAGYKLTPLQ